MMWLPFLHAISVHFAIAFWCCGGMAYFWRHYAIAKSNPKHDSWIRLMLLAGLGFATLSVVLGLFSGWIVEQQNPCVALYQHQKFALIAYSCYLLVGVRVIYLWLRQQILLGWLWQIVLAISLFLLVMAGWYGHQINWCVR